jgi:hypothetical protein
MLKFRLKDPLVHFSLEASDKGKTRFIILATGKMKEKHIFGLKSILILTANKNTNKFLWPKVKGLIIDKEKKLDQGSVLKSLYFEFCG